MGRGGDETQESDGGTQASPTLSGGDGHGHPHIRIGHPTRPVVPDRSRSQSPKLDPDVWVPPEAKGGAQEGGGGQMFGSLVVVVRGMSHGLTPPPLSPHRR